MAATLSSARASDIVHQVGTSTQKVFVEEGSLIWSISNADELVEVQIPLEGGETLGNKVAFGDKEKKMEGFSVRGFGMTPSSGAGSSTYWGMIVFSNVARFSI